MAEISMAESTADGHVDAGPPRRDVLLATKLHVPRAQPGLVARPRLAGRLDEGLDHGLVLIAAPAGYGKSLLLSQWARAQAQPVAWLSLDGRDNDPLGLARYRARGGLGGVRADDLRFTAGEAAELLGQVSADVDPSSAAALAERTQGWGAGRQ